MAPQSSRSADSIGGDASYNASSSNETYDMLFITLGVILVVILCIFLVRQIILGPYYKKKNRIDGKVVIITGCNTGIGKETALELAKRGATIYMACRDASQCEKARLEILNKSKNQNVFNRRLDLSSLESIRTFVSKFLQEQSRLDILINNAGIMGVPKGVTEDGFEQHMGVNHLGHFYLTNLLLDTMKSSAPSRIVVVSSAAYFLGGIRKDDINMDTSYSGWKAYCNSKLANVLFTSHLSKMLTNTGVTVNCLHPGVVKTKLSRHIIGKTAKIFIRPFSLYFFKSPTAGAQTTIRLALDPKLEKTSGNFYFDCYFKFPIIPKGKNPETAEWLWKISEEMTKLNKNNLKTIQNLT